MSRPGRRRAGLVKKLALLTIALVVGCLLVEAGIRVFSHFFFQKLMVVDATFGWRHAPNRSKSFRNEDGESILVEQNEHGQRGPAVPLARVAGKYRVLVLGDSFTEAIHVTDANTFVRRVEQSGADLEMINAGVGAWGTVQEWLYLDKVGVSFTPDLVLVVFYENDLADNLMSYVPGIGARPYARVGSSGVTVVEDYDDAAYLRFVLPIPFASFLVRHSYAFYALNERVWQATFKRKFRRLEDADRNALKLADKKAALGALLARVRSSAAGVHAKVGLVLIPTAADAASGESATHVWVRQWCAAHEFPSLSLLDPLHASVKRGERPYFDVDIHWTKTGHRVAAQAITPFVAKLRATTGK